ncbi:MAG: hypothetical protein HYZ53_18270 [Planctomycetes bacterium]|nr:hypothetical protein [Planctomycetota bacterium]
MGRVLIIAAATYREAGRQPILYIVTGFFAVLIYLSRWLTLFSFHVREELNMIREMGIASLTVSGIMTSVVLAALAITSDVERLTTLTILSKPVHRSQFLLGKYVGILWTVFLSSAFLTLSLVYTLWEKEGSRNMIEATDYLELNENRERRLPQFELEVEAFPLLRRWAPFLLASVPAGDAAPNQVYRWLATKGERAVLEHLRSRDQRLCAVGDQLPEGYRVVEVLPDHARVEYRSPEGGSAQLNLWREPLVGPVDEFLRVPFLGPCRMTYPAYVALSSFLGKTVVDLVGAAFLAFMQIAVLAAFAVGIAPHLPLVVNGAGCLLVFVLGHLSTYAHDLAGAGSWLVRGLGGTFYVLVPNLSLFNASSLLASGSEISPGYVTAAAAYGLLYLSAVLTVASALFSRKEVR